ncbi:hypothetical protein TW95_gp1432 [Pandoravirus inopinatum]|uniref:Uncharacterized protein n=1 Tax=Pandoravirus inopinatum TaxID=1605721 RepID=A0A0B5JB16_9VIRU|nr:hypothetical protein TW95_gp1432 [Pandoravirus inopinatum]AJF98166.1 hypothetical protein [Pandoravirus inopinatum]
MSRTDRGGMLLCAGRPKTPRRRAPWVAESAARPRLASGGPRWTRVIAAAAAATTAAVPLRSVHTLPIEYMHAAREVARQVQEKNRKAGVVDRREMRSRTSYDISAQGYFGEFLFAHLFRLSTRQLFNTTCRSALTETAFDGTLRPEGWTVDVKVSSADKGKLRVQQHKGMNPPDLYALFVYVNYVRGKPIDSDDLAAPVLRFDGFIPASAVFDARYLEEDDIYWVPTERLVTREALWAMASRGALKPPAGYP